MKLLAKEAGGPPTVYPRGGTHGVGKGVCRDHAASVQGPGVFVRTGTSWSLHKGQVGGACVSAHRVQISSLRDLRAHDDILSDIVAVRAVRK